MIIIDPKQTIDYVLKADSRKKNPPTFTLKPLSTRELIKIDLASKENQVDSMYLACELSLQGWTGVKTSDKKDLEFSIELVEELPAEVFMELFEKVIEISNLSEDDAKK